ncbi:hypothetical protein Tco_1272316 [Tanacetum coccineum]
MSWVSIGNGLLVARGGSCGGNGGRGGGRSSRESKNACGEVGGIEKMSSTGSKFMVRGKECLEGCVGAGGVVERYLEMMEELFGNRLEVIELDMEVMRTLI